MSCFPLIYAKNLTSSNSTLDNKTFEETQVANPCGLIANSYFNDTYKLFKGNNESVAINEKNITWAADRLKYKRHANWETT